MTKVVVSQKLIDESERQGFYNNCPIYGNNILSTASGVGINTP